MFLKVSTYPAWYLWVFIDGKFVRYLTEYGDVFRRRGAPVQIKSVITVRQSSSNLQIRKMKYHGCINKSVFISVLHSLTVSGRFRVEFGVGHD